MQTFRKYGRSPFQIVTVHGGPGAAGQMTPVSLELSKYFSVLEPVQSAKTIEGQVKELHDIISTHAGLPVTLIGHSWGAWLTFIYTSRFPQLVKKLVLVSSGPFLLQYASDILNTRINRLNVKNREELNRLLSALDDQVDDSKNNLLRQLSGLTFRTDIYKQAVGKFEKFEADYSIYINIWKEAEELRASGKLIECGKNILCPVVAFHGDFDPHPAEGVREPLSKVIRKFKFILLEKCGHYPWMEVYARDRFFSLLNDEINSSQHHENGVR